jgi:hypothetical protein
VKSVRWVVAWVAACVKVGGVGGGEGGACVLLKQRWSQLSGQALVRMERVEVGLLPH